MASSLKEQTVIDKCEEALGSDVATEKEIPDEIDKQLDSVSLSRKEIDEAQRHSELSWTGCYDDMCWYHETDKQGAGWYPKRPKSAAQRQKNAQRRQALEEEVKAQEQGKDQIHW